VRDDFAGGGRTLGFVPEVRRAPPTLTLQTSSRVPGRWSASKRRESASLKLSYKIAASSHLASQLDTC
jgi:hypothetical protein